MSLLQPENAKSLSDEDRIAKLEKKVRKLELIHAFQVTLLVLGAMGVSIHLLTKKK